MAERNNKGIKIIPLYCSIVNMPIARKVQTLKNAKRDNDPKVNKKIRFITEAPFLPFSIL